MNQTVTIDLSQGVGTYTSSDGTSSSLKVYSINPPTLAQLTTPSASPIVVARVAGGPLGAVPAIVQFDKDPNTGLNTNLVVNWPTSATLLKILDATYTVPGKYTDYLNTYNVTLIVGDNFPNLFSNVDSLYLQKYGTVAQCPAIGGVAPTSQTGNTCVYDANKLLFSMTAEDAMDFDRTFNMADEQTANGKNYLMSKWCSQMDPPNSRNSSKYCQNNQCPRYSNQPVCQTWCEDNQDLCNNAVTRPFCSSDITHLQDTTTCLKLCEDGNCDDFLTDRCPTLSVEDATGDVYGKYCSCFLDPSVYNDFFSKVQSKLAFLQVETTPGCFYPPCAIASVKKGKVTCPNINACIQGVVINESGDVNITDKNAIVVNQTGQCSNFKLSPKFCSDGEYLATGTSGQYCTPCPDGQTSNSDKTGCVPLYYNCINGVCSPTTDSSAQYQSLGGCLNSGCKGVNTYSCVDGKCVSDPNGIYSRPDCGGICQTPPKRNYLYWGLYGLVVVVLLVILVKTIFKNTSPTVQ